MEKTKTPRLEQYPPTDWTPAQWASAMRICQRYQVPFNPNEWSIDYLCGYVGKTFSGMFIGIEKDGYSHT